MLFLAIIIVFHLPVVVRLAPARVLDVVYTLFFAVTNMFRLPELVSHAPVKANHAPVKA
ncbi:MAG TPA: hypothetical protein PLJ60_16510 [Chryseolinea sp.]|nr:hypothetical protein [Chryseolinea sp.]HPH46363.1 hypothetical protein [Chryseolinea sp.]HPM31940.1 hypothetical protein [Chryseolinea sp.]